MTEKMLALIGVVLIIIVGVIGMSQAKDAATVTAMAGFIITGLGIVITLWRLGVNTDKTEGVLYSSVNLRKDVNGRLTELLEAVKEKAFAEGKLEGQKTVSSPALTEMVTQKSSEAYSKGFRDGMKHAEGTADE